ncbi:MAG: class I SAM-dependent methyltransferase [Bacteroidales bacterium]|nr:class I SAM-dependent methyltransferase [Bacteroidales bacterium]
MEETYEITLPQWLDDYIFNELGANYCPRYSDMVNIDDNKEKTLNYLGTYFPRSYAEACVLFTAFFDEEKRRYANKNKLTIFDFGCGTGGEIIGLLTAIEELLPNVVEVEIVALDGNPFALRQYEKMSAKFNERSRLNVKNRLFPITIDDFYDLSIVDEVITQKFDLIITFKAICEFVSKQQFEQHNPYGHIVRTFLPKLVDDGYMVLEDITVKSDVNEEWLPKMMDKGLQENGCEIVYENPNYNIAIYVNHSRKTNDVTKVAWRVIKRR